jgi:hypothetical protein
MSENEKSFFEYTEFYSDSETQDPEEVIQDRQDPEIAYAHICKIAGTINAGLDAVPEDQRDTVKVYSVVDLFRATMQYIEEFGSYFRYLILNKESYINEIIRTSSGDIRPLFEAILEEELDGYLDKRDVEADSYEVLSLIFGYQAVREGAISFSEEELEDVPVDVGLADIEIHEGEGEDIPESMEMELLVEDSIENLRNKLKNIAVFYLNFREAYNAVKHGNRVTVGDSTGFELGNDELLDDRIVLDDEVIQFLCKYSADSQDGEPYLLTIPRSILEEKTLNVVEDVYTLYTQAYDVATLDEGEEINLSFWKSTGDGGQDENDLIHIANPDSRILLPRDVMPDVIEDLQVPEKSTVEWIGNWSLAGDTLEFEVEFGSEPTPEHPIHVEINWEKTADDIHEFGEGQFNFNVDPDDLSVEQYFEMLKIQDKDDIRRVEFEFPDSDKTYQQRLEEPFEGIDLPEPEDRDILEFVKRVGLATDTRIPLPEFITEKHREVYDDYKDSDLDSDTAEEILSELQERGEKVRRSLVGVAVWEGDFSDVDVDEDEPAHAEDLGELRAIMGLSESQDADDMERFPGEVRWTHPESTKYTPDELLDKLREGYGETVGELQRSEVDREEAESEFSHRIRFGHETMWGTFDKHVIDIFPVSEGAFDREDSPET